MQEYFFNIEDVFSEQLHLTVWDSDFGLTDDFLGQLSLPLSEVYDAEHRSVDTWYTLGPRKAKEVVSGESRLSWPDSYKRQRIASGNMAPIGKSPTAEQASKRLGVIPLKDTLSFSRIYFFSFISAYL
jgi:hypothetical protein